MTAPLQTIYAFSTAPVNVATVASGSTAKQVWLYSANTSANSACVTAFLPLRGGTDPGARIGNLQRDLKTLSFWSEEDERPNPLAIHLALQLLETANTLGMWPSRLRSSPDGGVILAFRKGEMYGKLEAFNDGEILAATSGYSATPDVWRAMGAVAAKEALEKIRTHLG